MNTKKTLRLVMVVAVCGLTGVVITRRPATRTVTVHDGGASREAHSAARPNEAAAPETAPAAIELAAAAESGAALEAWPPPLVSAGAKTDGERQPSKTQPAPAQRSAKEPLQDPVARVALSFVGADPAAEAYWFGAINDPTLPAHERKDLIEDLNEDGLSDPKHPGPEDLPLIVSRLALIEEVALGAMDQVNADAFQEAYKDLVNMYDSLTARR